MKVLCDRDRLRDALSVVATALPTRTTKPILETVLLEANDNSLSLSSTDLEVAIRFTLTDLQVDQKGTCLVPAREASEFVRDLTDETVTLEVGKGSVQILGKDDTCELALADAGEYPGLPEMKGGAQFQMRADHLAELFERTMFAAAKELGRFAMNGVRLELEKDRLRLIATDGRRLSLASRPLENPIKQTVTATVPTKAIAQFLRVLQGSQDLVTVTLTEDKASLHAKNATIVTRLLEGEFPRYQAVIPKEGKNHAELDTKTLTQKLRLVANLCSLEQPVVKFKFSGSALTLTATSPQRGEARAEMPATFKGTNAEIGFNPEFVLEGLKVSRRESIRLEFSEKGAPGRLSLNEDHDYVVMPVVNE
jgi:DNA polymerase-3 subunit beta